MVARHARGRATTRGCDRARRGRVLGRLPPLVQPRDPRRAASTSSAATGGSATQLLGLERAHSSLVGQLVLARLPARSGALRAPAAAARPERVDARPEARLPADSVFSFSDLPIRLLTPRRPRASSLAPCSAARCSCAAHRGGHRGARLRGHRAAIVFFAGLNMLGLGIIGSYVWRAYENTKSRPARHRHERRGATARGARHERLFVHPQAPVRIAERRRRDAGLGVRPRAPRRADRRATATSATMCSSRTTSSSATA